MYLLKRQDLSIILRSILPLGITSWSSLWCSSPMVGCTTRLNGLSSLWSLILIVEVFQELRTAHCYPSEKQLQDLIDEFFFISSPHLHYLSFLGKLYFVSLYQTSFAYASKYLSGFWFLVSAWSSHLERVYDM